MGREGNGVEPREKSIRVNFTLDGAWQRVTLKLPPTTANLRHAEKLVVKVRAAIARGTFEWKDWFPDAPQAKKVAEPERNFGDWCDLWFKTKGQLASKTLNQYRNALGVWKGLFKPETAMAKLDHAVVAAKIGEQPWASAKLLNNYLIPLRGVFKLAGRALKTDNPMDGIENSKHQAPKPDPLSPEEMEQILAHLHQHQDVRAWAYFEFMFMTGMRPEEAIALRWGDVDWNAGSVRVERAKTSGDEKPLKTYNARDVDLVARALAALDRDSPKG